MVNPFLLLMLSLSVGCLELEYNADTTSKTCVVDSKNDKSLSDSAAIKKAFKECSTNGVIKFSHGVDYNVWEPVVAKDLSNVVIHLDGNWNLPQNVSAVQAIVKAAGGTLTWFQFKGENVKLIGSSNITTGWIRSYGQAWWDLNASNGTGTPLRPHLMLFSVTNGVIKHFKSLKPIGWNVKVTGNNITISDTFIDAKSSTNAFPFNTDGFDVSASDVVIRRSVIFNGDDAIAINNGAHNVRFEDAIIGYQTHGAVVGSLGSEPGVVTNVSNILFKNVTVEGGLYAARFKSWIGGQGLAKKITWKDFRVHNTTFPIFVTQTYYNQALGPVHRASNSSVKLEDFTWENFNGTINEYNPGDGTCVTDPCWYNDGLPNLNHTEALIIECNTQTSCANFSFHNIQIVPQSQKPPTQICINVEKKLNPDLGIDCRNGTVGNIK